MRDISNCIERPYDLFRGCEAMAKVMARAVTKAEWSMGCQDATSHWNRHSTKRGSVAIMFRVLSIRKHASIQGISTHPLPASNMRLFKCLFSGHGGIPSPGYGSLGRQERDLSHQPHLFLKIIALRFETPENSRENRKAYHC